MRVALCFASCTYFWNKPCFMCLLINNARGVIRGHNMELSGTLSSREEQSRSTCDVILKIFFQIYLFRVTLLWLTKIQQSRLFALIWIICLIFWLHINEINSNVFLCSHIPINEVLKWREIKDKWQTTCVKMLCNHWTIMTRETFSGMQMWKIQKNITFHQFELNEHKCLITPKL